MSNFWDTDAAADDFTAADKPVDTGRFIPADVQGVREQERLRLVQAEFDSAQEPGVKAALGRELGRINKTAPAVDAFWSSDAAAPSDAARALPAGVKPSQAGAGRGSVNPAATRLAVPEMTAGSLARDGLSGALQIGPTLVGGLGDIARLVTGDRIGKGLSEFGKEGNLAFHDMVGSDRAAAQRAQFSQDMANPDVGIADTLLNNKGALADQILPTLSSMILPTGVAGAAGKLATAGRAAQALSATERAALAARAVTPAVIGTTVAQNAGDTYSTIRDAGGDQAHAYGGAGIAAVATLAAGKLTGGGAEAAAARALLGHKAQPSSALKSLALAPLKEGVQEVGEQLGQSVGEALGKGEALDPLMIGKEAAVAGTLGAVIGGGIHVAADTAPNALRTAQLKAAAEGGNVEAALMLEIERKHGRGATNFTEPGSPSDVAKLTPIVIPGAVATPPKTEEDVYVRASTALAALSGARGAEVGDQPDGSPSNARRGVDDGADGGLRDVPAQSAGRGVAGESAVPGGDAADSTSGVVAPGDDSPAAAALKPAETWLGRKGAGFSTEGDAEQARKGRAQTAPDLDWRAEPIDGGRFAVNGYTRSELDVRANAAATSPTNDIAQPTEAQKEAGNYKKGHVAIGGLDISIENPRGSARNGVDKGGKPWSVTMANHYGYIKNTTGADKDHVDVIVGPDAESQTVFVVDQVHPAGTFDEHKVVLGARSQEQAMAVYRSNYAPGWRGAAGITAMPMAQFKVWVKAGAKTRPLTNLRGVDNDTGSAPAVGGLGAGAVVAGAQGPAAGVRAGKQLSGGAGGRDVSGRGTEGGSQAAGQDQERKGLSDDIEATQPSANNGALGNGRRRNLDLRQPTANNQNTTGGPVAQHRLVADPARAQAALRTIENSRLKRGEAIKLDLVENGDQELEDASHALAAVFGAPVIHVKQRGEAAPAFSGVNSGGVIVLMNKAADAHIALTWHEVVHSFDEDILATLIAAVRPMMNKAAFKADFKNYPDAKVEEEIVARLAQQHSKTREFLDELAAKLPAGEFQTLIGHILAKLSELVGRFRANNLTHYATDIENVRDFLTTAFAEQARRAGIAREDANIDFADRIKTPTPAVTRLLKHLTAAERVKVTDKVAAKIITMMKSFPSANEFAAAAFAGRAKRGWYQQSAQTIADVFGADAPRFVALLAAMSPQCSVENNLNNALNTWKNWVAAGRPVMRDAIVAVMGKSVGDRGRASVLPSWINNSVRALTLDNVAEALLSGPKVNSFFKNLIGHVEEITNDVWMSNFALVDQTVFKGELTASGNDSGKGTGYLAMNARVREAAAVLTKLTGERWTPAEVQETVWSWAKTLYEMSASADESRSARQIVEDGDLTDERINSTPDFGSLFLDAKYANILKEAGYGNELDSIANSRANARRTAAGQVESQPRAGGQTAPFAGDAQKRYELTAARRLERLQANRGDALAAGAEQRTEEALNDGNTEDTAAAASDFSDNETRAFVEGLRVAGRVGRSHESLALDSRPQQGHRGTSLAGLPSDVQVAGQVVRFGGFKPAQEAAARYAKAAGIAYRPATAYVKADPRRGQRIADAFEAMAHDAQQPDVKAAYAAMIAETLAQYEAILGTGLAVEFIDGADPYGNPRNAILDVTTNNHLFVFPTTSGFGSQAIVNIGLATNDGKGITVAQVITMMKSRGAQIVAHAVHQSDSEQTLVATLATPLDAADAAALSDALDQDAIAQIVHGQGELYGPRAAQWQPFNGDYFLMHDGKRYTDIDPADRNPLLAPTQHKISGRTALVNDVFRVVHDYFGHVKEGVGFRADGEVNAWRAHAAMYTPLARRAMTTETRGQNSWVNFGPQGAANKTTNGADTTYAEQKIGLLPEWASDIDFSDNAFPPIDVGALELEKFEDYSRRQRRNDSDFSNIAEPMHRIASPVDDVPAENPAAIAALRGISRRDALFANPKSAAKGLREIVADEGVGLQMREMTGIDFEGERQFVLTTPDDKSAFVSIREAAPHGQRNVYSRTFGDRQTVKEDNRRPGSNADAVNRRTEEVYIDVSRLTAGSGMGAHVYNIAMTFAHNTGRIFIGDPNGLSDIAMQRRPHQMLSSALKFGTTRHLAPHPFQVEGGAGVPPLAWTYGDDDANVTALAEIITKMKYNGRHDELRFDAQDGRFYDARGVRVSRAPDAGRGAAATGLRRDAGDGGTRAPVGASVVVSTGTDRPLGTDPGPRETDFRRALLRAALATEGDAVADGGQGVLVSLGGIAREHGDALVGIFYADNLADVSALGFYSELSRRIAAGPGRAMPDQWRAYIRGLTSKGVRADEIAWSGVEEWLSLQTDKVEKSAVGDYLRENGVRVDEVQITDAPPPVSAADIDWSGEWEVVNDEGYQTFSTREQAEDYVNDEGGTIQPHRGGEGLGGGVSRTLTKYGRYTLPGGTNYREVLLTLPPKTPEQLRVVPHPDAPEAFAMQRPGGSYVVSGPESITPGAVKQWHSREFAELYGRDAHDPGRQGAYKSGHWDQLNVLAHVRVNDRVDADGKKVLFVEEIQSDWAQQGKRDGFGVKDSTPLTAEENRELDKLFDLRGGRTAEQTARMHALDNRLNAVSGKVGIPAAPFVGKTDAWVALALKRVIKMAVDGGYDSVAMVTGEQSADRYELSKQVESIQYRKSGDDNYSIKVIVSGGSPLHLPPSLDADGVEAHVGKELAKRIVETATGKYQTISGDGLKVGGDGMKAFYDKIVPGVLKDVLRKLGGEGLTQVAIHAGQWGGDYEGMTARQIAARNRENGVGTSHQPGFVITPKLRAAAGEGLPMFSDNAKPRADAFKKWFGRSQVVDKNGKPLVVYHGTTDSFDTFDAKKLGQASDHPTAQLGFFFSASADIAEDFALGNAADGSHLTQDGANIMPAHLRISAPYDMTASEFAAEIAQATGKQMRALRKRLVADGHDGILVHGDDEHGARELHADTWVAFEPSQIKSAVGNRGAFAAADPRIDYAFNLDSIRRPTPASPTRATEGWILSRDELGNFRLGAGAKLYRKVALVANAVANTVAMKPMGPELRRALRVMKSEINAAMKLTADAAQELGRLPEAERLMISDIIENELAAGVRPPAKVLELAATISALMGKQSDDLVAVGMLDQDAADQWRDKYLPRFYQPKLAAQGKDLWAKAVKAMSSKPRALTGIGGKSLMRRGMTEVIEAGELAQYQAMGWAIDDKAFKPGVSQRLQVHRDFTRAEREKMGEIRDAMFRFTMGYMRSQKDLALGRLYAHLNDTLASPHELEGFVRVPDTRIDGTDVNSYGKLAGQWVPKEVLDHLSKFGESEYEAVLVAYRKALGMWKEGKTALNPVSHMNNVASNLTMAHFAGVSYWDAHKYAATITDFVRGGPMLAEAREAGLFGGTVSQEELMSILPKEMQVLAQMTRGRTEKAVEHVWNMLSLFLRKPLGAAYEAEDLFFRHLIYREARGKGLHPNDAVDYAQRFIFTYDDLPKGARIVRDTALPFFSYTYKVVPVLAHTLLNHPWRYAAPAMALYAINAAMYALAAGGDDDDWEKRIRDIVDNVVPGRGNAKAAALEAQERKNLPPWMKGHGFTLGTPRTIRLGMDDLTQMPVFMDVSRMFPGGDLLDANSNTGGVPILQPLTPSNPLLNTLYAMQLNRDPYFGKDVVDTNDTAGEAAKKRGAWLWSQFAPAIAVNNYIFNRSAGAVASATGHTIPWWPEDFTGIGKDGLPVQPGYAAMQNIGIKARPIDLNTAEKIDASQKRKIIADLNTEIRSIRRLGNRGALSAESVRAKIDLNREKIGRLRQGLTVDGDEKE